MVLCVTRPDDNGMCCTMLNDLKITLQQNQGDFEHNLVNKWWKLFTIGFPSVPTQYLCPIDSSI